MTQLTQPLYRITESCMRPSGAYAKSLSLHQTRAEAEEAFKTASFVGPGFGILWSKTVTLTETGWVDGTYQRTVLQRRTIDTA